MTPCASVTGQLINLTREGTVVAAFQGAHDKFHRLHVDCLRLAAMATTDDEALNELLQTLHAYTALFNEHHHAEDHYFFPALRQAEPEHLLFEDTETVPALSSWTDRPI